MSSRRGLRRRLEVTLVGVALVSVLLLAGVNYLFARMLITESVESQLGALRDTRTQSIEASSARVQADVATLAVTPSLVGALEELSAAYTEFGDTLTSGQVGELEAAYAEATEPLEALGLDVPTRSLLPSSASGRSLQYQYIVQNPSRFDDRDQLDDAGDGSQYSDVHAVYHPLLRALMQNAGMTDLMLIDADTREVVYSTKKRIDVGTDAADGPWADGALGDVVEQLSRTAVGDTVISDTSFYAPARGQAVVLLGTAIRSGAEVVGSVVTELPVDAITDLATSMQSWEALGLGETGDIYLVGPDGTLRTDARPWLDDPEAFLRDFLDRSGDEAATEKMRTVGSAALTQEVDNRAVRAALAGDTFVGTVKKFDGDTTFAASGPVKIGGQDWAVVVEQDRSEAMEGLRTLLRSTLVVMAILLPITALIGWWMARSLTRPFSVLVDAAARIARGEPATGVGQLGNNELGDVGRQLEVVAARLEEEEATIASEEANINEVLGAVVPARLIERVRQGERSIVDLLDTATVISLLVDGMPEATGSEQDTVVEIAEQLTAEAGRLVQEFGVERVRLSSTNALFVAGLGAPDACVDDALRFAVAVTEVVAQVGAEFGQPLAIRAGLAAGDLASGVIGQQQLTFSVWGDPVTTAFALASVAQPGEILVDAAVRPVVEESWELEARVGLAGLDDDMEAWSVRLREVVEP